MATKYLYLNTIGCQMNVYDSEQIAMRLAALGYQQTSSLDKADLVIVNTCTIRAKAEQKAFSFLGRLARLKKKKPGPAQPQSLHAGGMPTSFWQPYAGRPGDRPQSFCLITVSRPFNWYRCASPFQLLFWLCGCCVVTEIFSKLKVKTCFTFWC